MRLQSSELLRDARNVELLRLLRDDPCVGTSELARRVGMSAPAVRERVPRLEEAGVIRGYRLELDPAALGYPVCAFVRVRPAPGRLPKVAELAERLPQVAECHRVTGEDCFVLKVHLPGLDRLDEVLDRFLAHGQTTTSIVQSTPVPPRGLPSPDDSSGKPSGERDRKNGGRSGGRRRNPSRACKGEGSSRGCRSKVGPRAAPSPVRSLEAATTRLAMIGHHG